jgi:gamma-glutamylputrescine oxidase
MAEGSDYPNSWYVATSQPGDALAPLVGEVNTDVCIIGGGYTGLSAAIHLRKLGYEVTLLEAKRAGWGASGRNGGHVGTGQRAGQDELEKWMGLDQARALWQLGLDAVGLVESLVGEFAIECELGQGNLYLASKRSHDRELLDEVAHLQQRYGYSDVRYVAADEIHQYTSAQGCYGGMLDSGARHLGLRDAARALGAKIYEYSPAQCYTESTNSVLTKTPSGSVRSRFLVLGCNGYLGKLEPRIAGNIMPINNFMIATAPLTEALRASINPKNISMSDSLFVIDYWKFSADGRLLFGGGENYTSRFPKDIKSFVRPYMLKLYPELARISIDYGWGGTLGITMNRMPDFGRLGRNIFYAQGFSGHGVPTATMAGQLMAHAIDGNAERFNLMASVPTHRFPGGTLLRWPGLVAGMLFYSLLDKLG